MIARERKEQGGRSLKKKKKPGKKLKEVYLIVKLIKGKFFLV